MKPRIIRRALLDALAWIFLVTAAAVTLRAAVSLGRIGLVLATGHEPAILGQMLATDAPVASDNRR